MYELLPWAGRKLSGLGFTRARPHQGLDTGTAANGDAGFPKRDEKVVQDGVDDLLTYLVVTGHAVRRGQFRRDCDPKTMQRFPLCIAAVGDAQRRLQHSARKPIHVELAT